jgi:hypothetical protein
VQQDSDEEDEDLDPIPNSTQSDLCDILPQILERLRNPESVSLNALPIPLQAGGYLQTPFGAERLKVTEVLKEIVRMRKPAVLQKICDLKLLAGCVALCREYKWNNCLHNTVHLMFEFALDSSLVDRDLKI